MTDVTNLPLPTKTTRKNIVVTTLLFCWAIIVWLIADGEPSNSLHSSALAWAWGVSMTVIMAYVFGAVVDNFNALKSSNGQIKTLE